MQKSARNLHKHHVSGLFVFLLIAAYAMFSLLLVLIGVRVYKSVVDVSERNNQVRTTINYVANKVRAADGTIRLQQIDGKNVLTIREAPEPDGGQYETRIYYMREPGESTGALYEQAAEVSDPFDPALGELVSRVADFSITQDGHLMLLELTSLNGEKHRMHLSPRAEGKLQRAG